MMPLNFIAPLGIVQDHTDPSLGAIDWSLAAAFHSPANASAGCAQIRALLAPKSCRRFIAEHWETSPHVVRGAALHSEAGAGLGFGGGLLRVADLARLARHWEFKVAADHAQVRMIPENSFSHDEAGWADGAPVRAADLRRAHARNCTVVMHNVELYHPPIGALALALMRTFGVYSQSNVYYSPPGVAAAVHAHQDAQSVFVVQCVGAKRWELFEPPQRWRLRQTQRGKGGDVAPAAYLAAPLLDVTLYPGDVLFVPRGTYHRTSTAPSSGATLHVTSGVETDTDDFTWFSLLSEAAASLVADSDADVRDVRSKFEAAQYHHEGLREALPLALCRPPASFRTHAHGRTWLARAAELLDLALVARPAAGALAAALDAALARRQAFVERKRLQLVEFMPLGLELAYDGT